MARLYSHALRPVFPEQSSLKCSATCEQNNILIHKVLTLLTFGTKLQLIFLGSVGYACQHFILYKVNGILYSAES